MKRTMILALAVCISAAAIAQDGGWDPLGGSKGKGNGNGRIRDEHPTRPANNYLEAIRRTSEMVGDQQAQRLAQRYGLNVLNVTWEDTGRYKGSSVGPNISDMTIQVGVRDPRTRRYDVTLMPVVRFPNFSDVTTDISPHDFTLMVGNEQGQRLQRVSLYEFLENPTLFLSEPQSWRGRNRTLLADRDDKVLVSAQAAFLPVPQQGKATFNPVVFNYQSYENNPAVLTILATREGTSTTIIDNKRDAFPAGSVWGQRLFHNQNGQRASLTGERITDFLNKGGDRNNRTASSGLNMVLLIQVPLKQRESRRKMDAAAEMAPMAGANLSKSRRGSDVEAAVIGHGAMEGPFTEIDNLAIERDPRFPIRVTVQFYKATSNGIVSEADMRQIKSEIEGVYAHGDTVGSLVTGGETGRPTEYWGRKRQPRDWWESFWRRHEANTGMSREESMRRLQRLMGDDYMEESVSNLYLCDLLRKGRR